jgi:apolipoprotein N-acyltransferase
VRHFSLFHFSFLVLTPFPLSTTSYHQVEDTGVKEGDIVGIWGVGVIGLMVRRLFFVFCPSVSTKLTLFLLYRLVSGRR